MRRYIRPTPVVLLLATLAAAGACTHQSRVEEPATAVVDMVAQSVTAREMVPPGAPRLAHPGEFDREGYAVIEEKRVPRPHA